MVPAKLQNIETSTRMQSVPYPRWWSRSFHARLPSATHPPSSLQVPRKRVNHQHTAWSSKGLGTLVSQGCRNTPPRPRWLETTELYPRSSGESLHPGGIRPPRRPLGTSGVLGSRPRNLTASTPTRLSTPCDGVSSSVLGGGCLDLGSTDVIQERLALRFLTSTRLRDPVSQIRSQSQVPGWEMGTYVFGHTGHPTTGRQSETGLVTTRRPSCGLLLPNRRQETVWWFFRMPQASRGLLVPSLPIARTPRTLR